jgi:hypothetical protein
LVLVVGLLILLAAGPISRLIGIAGVSVVALVLGAVGDWLACPSFDRIFRECGFSVIAGMARLWRNRGGVRIPQP